MRYKTILTTLVGLAVIALILLPIARRTEAAVSATNLTTSGSNTDATSYATASITPSANKLILAWVWAVGADTPPEATLTGNGLTWVNIGTVAFSPRRMTLFRAMGASPSAEVVTIDFGGDTQTGATWSIVEYDGVDTSGTDGSGAVVQVVTGGSGSNTADGASVTLAAFESALNATVGAFGIPLNSAGVPDPGVGFTETGQRNQNNPNLAIMSEFKADNDTTVDGVWTGASVPYTVIAAEIRAASAAPPASTVKPNVIFFSED